MKKTLDYLMWGVIVAPLIYLAFVWDQLPEIVPTHFGISGQPDAYGPKWTLIILSAVSVGIYFLLRYVPQLDPRLNQARLSEHYPKLVLLILTFMGAIQVLIIRSAMTKIAGEAFTNIIFVGVFLLLAGIGNYLNNIKSNYFVGIRTPWTLESEANWRATHQLASRIWFAGGIAMAVLALFLPMNWVLGVFITLVVLMTIIPTVYSYRYFKVRG